MSTPAIDLFIPSELSLDAPVRKLVKLVLLMAIRDGAREIRFEPQENTFYMAYKANGIYLEMVPPPAHLGHAVVSGLRGMADLDHATRHRRQHGFFQVRLSGQTIDVWVYFRRNWFGECADLFIPDCRQSSDAAWRTLEAYRQPLASEEIEFIEVSDDGDVPRD
jgi:type IV pilus assembly protein PilB